MDTWIDQKAGSPEESHARRGDDPLRAARQRGVTARQELLRREGGTWTLKQAAANLGVSAATVETRRRAGKLIGVKSDAAGYVYPAWQFVPSGILAGLEETLAALSVRDPWMQAAYFLSGDPRLDGARPLDELRQGHIDAVRRAASGYGEHGAA
jgi:hypothetical protein